MLKMKNEPEAFTSNITRSARPLKNNLYDLLKIIPAEPVVQKKNDKRLTCDFQPRNDKHFEPKKKTKFKVRTVRDIRNSFEKDVYCTLPTELEKQQNVLLRKIKAGSSRDENTKTLAKNMLKCDKPITRSAWQMLMNLNPEEQSNPTQFVLWNGKRIQVNGSKGGKLKFICKYDLGVKKVPTVTSKILKRKSTIKRKGLLQNSLSIKLKPGPLAKKKFLDDSYQKYHVGEIELLDLPMPGLEIQPAVGKTVDPTKVHFLNRMQEADGSISDKWAEFSVSVLATIKKDKIVQIEEESCVTFDLSYKCDQRRILMRRDTSSDFQTIPFTKNEIELTAASSYCVEASEIESLLDKILDSVEISLEQDHMYSGQDEPRNNKPQESNSNGGNVLLKERVKRKFGELERLDVTIIRLSDNPDQSHTNVCNKTHCILGCVCASLECAYNLKMHCGRIECMFECKCDFSKFKVVDSFERDCSELIPGLLNMDSEIISKMAKEEQKFHQTVIVTSENSMLLKSNRRNWKSSKKYADFYNSMCLKNENKSNKFSAVVLEKLNIDNIEPWCMIHNLYKCFCKGKFTAHSIQDVTADDNNSSNVVQQNNICITDDQTQNVEKCIVKYNLKPRMPSKSHNNLPDKKLIEDVSDIIYDGKSARIEPYKGRKYTKEYYLNANKKIMDMEKHDNTLRNRMINLINISANKSLPQTQNVETLEFVEPITADVRRASTPPLLQTEISDKKTVSNIKMFTKRIPDKTKLVAWLETSYKHYKQRVDQGIVKVSLDPPKLGKMALYPWEFILSRYRDQKNLFLISKQPQYRIFMAVDTKNPFFDNCININDIRFADLQKYPITVKNLLTNAKDLKDNFCILCGLSYCWELIGSVTKICDQQENSIESKLNNEFDKDEDPAMSTDTYDNDSEDSLAATSTVDQYTEEKEPINKDNETISDSSKWFVMTVENDFDEIQFYNKGFFVKLDSIIKAINVARATGKTVRLSSQKCVDNMGPQFGIYAIPNKNESCVFVGPYDKHESLGIETVKKILDIRKQKRTRGVWITTKKLENFKVIDNPLSFMPPKNSPLTEMVTLAGDSPVADDKETESTEINIMKETGTRDKKDCMQQQRTKVLKPIKIRKTNGFFHLAPNGTLKQISHQQIQLHNPVPTSNDATPQSLNASLTKLSESPRTVINSAVIPVHKKPVAEIAPQVKITRKSSESENKSFEGGFNKKERGMFILKPEEINKRLMQNQISSDSDQFTVRERGVNATNDQELEMDIENFLATAEECVAPNDDVLIISDDEIDLESQVNKSRIERWENVWIECKTVENLGWIPARRNKKGCLSFEFPGFKYTEFYNTEDAFTKLHQVLSRKVYIPKNINLEWHVIDSEQDLGTKQLRTEDLGPDFVMTKRGIRHKQDLASGKHVMNIHSSEESDDHNSCDSKVEKNKKASNCYLEKPKECIEDLETTSQLLEDEGELLWDKLTSNSNHSEALDDLREQIAARLQRMVSNT